MSTLPPPPALEAVCAKAQRLPSAPALLPRLIAVMRDESSTAEEIGQIIQLDPALATSTLRVVNSAAFARETPVGGLEEAIVYLGYREVYRLASVSLLTRWERFHQATLPWDPGDYARHSFIVAVAAEEACTRAGLGDPGLAYAAGLVCDVGKLALAFLCAPYYARIAALAAEATLTWEQAETAVLGYNHTEVGARLLRQWNFPAAFVTVVENQAKPEAAGLEDQPLLACVHAAKYLAAALGPGLARGGALFELQGDFLQRFGLTAAVLEQAMQAVSGQVAERLGPSLAHGV